MKCVVFFFLLLCVCWVESADECSRLDADVLILGGGIAGVATANRLQTMGTDNFLVFEAGESLGGRMKRTELFPGFFFTEGPNFIAGVDSGRPELHPIYKQIQDCGGLNGVFPNGQKVYNGTSDVTPQFDTQTTAYYGAYYGAEHLASNLRSQKMPDISVGEGYERNGWVAQTPLDNLTEWYNFDFIFAKNPYTYSLYAYVKHTTYEDFLSPEAEEGTDYYITDQRGFVEVVNCLASNFSDKQVHLSSVVTKINNYDDCVCIEALEKGQTNRYCDRYAVLTFSMGVIKSDTFRGVLSPYFSQARQEAMDVFTMSNYLNILAVFDRRFWDTDVFYINRVDPERGNFPVIINGYIQSSINATLLVVTGDVADKILEMDLEMLNQTITEVFQSIYGEEASPPTYLYRQSYESNPLFLGSFVSLDVGLKEDTFTTIKSPEKSLHFAGEAYHERYSGYVHGAYLSAIDTATDIHTALTQSPTDSSATCNECLNKITVFVSILLLMYLF